MDVTARWIGAFTLGELVGFGLMPTVGGLAAAEATAGLDVSARALALYAVAVVGGLGEGAVVGAFQARVLRDVVPGLPVGRWIGHTAAAAAVAWALGMLAPTLDDLVGLSPLAWVLISVPTSVAILLSIGLVQSRLLRGLVDRPGTWLVANVLGWLLGLPWTFALPMSLPDDAPAWQFGLAFGIGGVLMGATAGLVTSAPVRRYARALLRTGPVRLEPVP